MTALYTFDWYNINTFRTCLHFSFIIDVQYICLPQQDLISAFLYISIRIVEACSDCFTVINMHLILMQWI